MTLPLRLHMERLAHPFDYGDEVVFAGRRGVVNGISWDNTVAMVTVTVGGSDYKTRASAVKAVDAVTRLGEIKT